MSSSNSPNNRNLTKLLIDPLKQIKIGLYMIGISLGFIVVSGYLFVNAFSDQYQHLMTIFQVADPSDTWELIMNDVFKANAIKVLIFFAVFFIVTIYIVFSTTHKYYGPLISIERFIQELTEGNYEARVQIRKKDELQNLVSKLNDLAVQLEKKHPKS